MPKVNYCPACGYDFRNKNWTKESEILFKRYDNQTYAILKKVINISARYTEVYPEDVYKFLKGISILEEMVVFEGAKTFLSNEMYHTKGLNYAKYIMINFEKNKDKIIKRLQKLIGGKAVELKGD